MSSILTNASALTAVANLNATQASLSQVQNEISTGLKVSSAQDNAAYYSIATTLRTNIGNLGSVSDSLNFGTSVVATATAATGNLTSVLQSISNALVSASQPGTDLDAVQTQITALRTQLANTVSTASFNGVNLLNGSNAANPLVQFVAGVTGSGANTTINNLTVDTSNTNFQGADYTSGNNLVTAAATADSALVNAQSANTTALTGLKNAVASLATADFSTPTSPATYSTAFQNVFGTSAVISSGGVVSGISATSIAGQLVGSTGSVTISSAGGGTVSAYSNASGATSAATGGTLYTLYGASASNASGASTTSGANGAAITADAAAKTDPTANAIYSGALFKISQISLASADGSTPATSQSQIQTYIDQVGAALTTVNNASETLGAASSNISLQATYTTSLTDSLTTGVGSLVDADLNEASTRLNALQTQQQLGVQALSVANQNSQLILKLFQ